MPARYTILFTRKDHGPQFARCKKLKMGLRCAHGQENGNERCLALGPRVGADSGCRLDLLQEVAFALANRIFRLLPSCMSLESAASLLQHDPAQLYSHHLIRGSSVVT